MPVLLGPSAAAIRHCCGSPPPRKADEGAPDPLTGRRLPPSTMRDFAWSSELRLVPHLWVRERAFPLGAADPACADRPPGCEAARRLESNRSSTPAAALSGGQQQRVAVAEPCSQPRVPHGRALSNSTPSSGSRPHRSTRRGIGPTTSSKQRPGRAMTLGSPLPSRGRRARAVGPPARLYRRLREQIRAGFLAAPHQLLPATGRC